MGSNGSALLRIVVVTLLTLTGGCAAYLHNPERASATADLKAKFGQLSTPAYFEAQDKNLKDFAGREDSAVAEFLVASRNYRLLNLIEPAPDAEHLTTRQRLERFIDEDFTSAIGRTLTAKEVQDFSAWRFNARLADRTLARAREVVEEDVRAYKKAEGKLPTGCDAVLANPAPPHATEPQRQTYEYLAKDCARLDQREAAINGCIPAPAGGALADVCGRIAEFDADKSNEDRKKELAAAEKALTEALEAMKANGEASTAKQIEDFIASVQELPDDEKLQAVLTQLDTVFGSSLQKAVDQISRTGKPALTRYADPLIKALVTFEAIQRVQDETKPADKSSALLIGLAKVRHDLNVVNIDIAAKTAEASLLRDQVAALHSQIYFLGRAQTDIGNGDTDAALNDFIYSVNKGQIPYRVTQFRFIQVRRSAALKHAKATEADYRALLQPAIDQLAAYGEGGIKAETIADILAGLPAAIPVLKD